MRRKLLLFVIILSVLGLGAILFALRENSKPEAVFQETDFELCSLPLPDGYPNSWTHAGIEYVKEGYNGYKYFLTCSPYPNYNDDYENPMLYYANPREGNLPPVVFDAYKDNPLQEDPGDGYNADPDVIFVDSNLYVINRPYLRPDSVWVNIQKSSIDSGCFTFNNPTLLYDKKQDPYNFGFVPSFKQTLIAPSIIKYKDEYRIYHLATNSYNDNTDCKGVVVMVSDTIDGQHSYKYYKTGTISSFPAKPWHFDVFKYQDKLYAIICAYVHEDPFFEHVPIIARFVSHERKCFQYLAESDDGINFTVFNKPLTTVSSYRSSAFVREDGMLVLYISTLGYKPKGNISEDGRNIMMAYKPFEQILKDVKR